MGSAVIRLRRQAQRIGRSAVGAERQVPAGKVRVGFELGQIDWLAIQMFGALRNRLPVSSSGIRHGKATGIGIDLDRMAGGKREVVGGPGVGPA